MDLAKLIFVDGMAFVVVAVPTLLVAMKIVTRERPVRWSQSDAPTPIPVR